MHLFMLSIGDFSGVVGVFIFYFYLDFSLYEQDNLLLLATVIMGFWYSVHSSFVLYMFHKFEKISL